MTTLVKVFDILADAERARDELLARGFSASCIHLRAHDDEAGPVEGNFSVGNCAAREARAGARGFWRALTGAPDPYAYKYAKAVQRGSYVLTIDAEEGESSHASEIARRCGAADIGERTPGGTAVKRRDH